jgi:hypothetical protein
MSPKEKGWLTTALIFLLLLSAFEMLEHTRQLKPKQTALIKMVPRNSETNVVSDSILYWSIGPLGKSFPINADPMNKNQRHIYILTM